MEPPLHLPSAHDPNARGRLSLARLSDKFAIIIQAARLRSNMAPAQTSNKLAPKPASQPASAAAPNSPPAVSWRRANLLQAPKTTNKQWAAPRPIGASSPHRRQAPAGGATDAPLVNIGRRPSTATHLSPGLACSRPPPLLLAHSQSHSHSQSHLHWRSLSHARSHFHSPLGRSSSLGLCKLSTGAR